MYFVTELFPPAFLTVKLTVYVPFLTYLCEGSCTVDVFPSPNFQDQELGILVLLSVNFTVRGALPLVGDAVKAATGFFGAVTTI